MAARQDDWVHLASELAAAPCVGKQQPNNIFSSLSSTISLARVSPHGHKQRGLSGRLPGWAARLHPDHAAVRRQHYDAVTRCGASPCLLGVLYRHVRRYPLWSCEAAWVALFVS